MDLKYDRLGFEFCNQIEILLMSLWVDGIVSSSFRRCLRQIGAIFKLLWELGVVLTPVIPALLRLETKGDSDLQASLGHRLRHCL